MWRVIAQHWYKFALIAGLLIAGLLICLFKMDIAFWDGVFSAIVSSWITVSLVAYFEYRDRKKQYEPIRDAYLKEFRMFSLKQLNLFCYLKMKADGKMENVPVSDVSGTVVYGDDAIARVMCFLNRVLSDPSLENTDPDASFISRLAEELIEQGNALCNRYITVVDPGEFSAIFTLINSRALRGIAMFSKKFDSKVFGEPIISAEKDFARMLRDVYGLSRGYFGELGIKEFIAESPIVHKHVVK